MSHKAHPSISPNPRRRVRTARRALALACAAFALAASTATAYPQPTAGPPASSETPTTIVQVPAATGFDWGDAGIGAAGVVALAMLGVGGALVISHRRPRRATTPRA